MAPCPWWYSHKKLSTIFLSSLFAWSVWNGASYYVDVFGQRFKKELEDLRREVSTYEDFSASQLLKVNNIMNSDNSFLSGSSDTLKTELKLNKFKVDSDVNVNTEFNYLPKR